MSNQGGYQNFNDQPDYSNFNFNYRPYDASQPLYDPTNPNQQGNSSHPPRDSLPFAGGYAAQASPAMGVPDNYQQYNQYNQGIRPNPSVHNYDQYNQQGFQQNPALQNYQQYNQNQGFQPNPNNGNAVNAGPGYYNADEQRQRCIKRWRILVPILGLIVAGVIATIVLIPYL